MQICGKYWIGTHSDNIILHITVSLAAVAECYVKTSSVHIHCLCSLVTLALTIAPPQTTNYLQKIGFFHVDQSVLVERAKCYVVGIQWVLHY